MEIRKAFISVHLDQNVLSYARQEMSGWSPGFSRIFRLKPGLQPATQRPLKT